MTNLVDGYARVSTRFAFVHTLQHSLGFARSDGSSFARGLDRTDVATTRSKN
jgi:hypothetical protein